MQVEVKRAVPRTKGPSTSASSSATSKAQPHGAPVKISSTSGSVVVKAGSATEQIAAKKPTQTNKTATNVAIASVGVRTRPPPAKNSNAASYAAALRAGHNNDVSVASDSALDVEYPSLVSANVASGAEMTEDAADRNPQKFSDSDSNGTVWNNLPSEQSGTINDSQPQYLRSVHSSGMPNRDAEAHRGREFQQVSPEAGRGEPILMPQSQRGFTLPPGGFNDLDMSRPIRSVSDSFTSSTFPAEGIPSLAGYSYNNVIPPSHGFGDTVGGLDLSSGYSHSRREPLDGLSGGNGLYTDPSHSFCMGAPGPHDSRKDAGNDGQFGALGWFPASLSASAPGQSQRSELDSGGEDVIGLGLALSMNLDDIQLQGQHGSSRVVSDSRAEGQRSRGPALSCLSDGSSGSNPPSYLDQAGNNSSDLWGGKDGMTAPYLSGDLNGQQGVQQEWYPQLQDLRSSAAEFKPMTGSDNNGSTNSSMPWMHT